MEFIFSKFMHRSTKSSVNQPKQTPEKQQQCVSPKMNAEKQDDLINQQFTDFSKENITNPKSLTEIATESTSKLSAAIPHDLNVTKTSTPKYLKSRDKILDEDSNDSFPNNIRPAYRQLNMNDSHKADDSLAFLTEGLCNFALDDSHKLDNYDHPPQSNNLTLSDDEFVECQSFSNFNSYPRTQQTDAVASLDSSARTFDFTKSVVESNVNVTAPSENVQPAYAKDSFRFAQQIRHNDSYSLDDSPGRSPMNINNTTRTVDNLEDMERVLEQNLPTQDTGKNERISEGGNKTINDIESKFPDEINTTITKELEEKDDFPGSSVNPNATFEQEAINTTQELSNENLQKDVLTGSCDSQNVTFEQETAHVSTEVPAESMSPVSGLPSIQIQQATPELKSLPEMSPVRDDEIIANSAIADIVNNIKKEVEVMEVDQQEEEEYSVDKDVVSQFPITPTRGLKHPFTIVNDISFGHQSPCSDIEMKEEIMREIQSEIEEEFKMSELNEPAKHDKTLPDKHEVNVETSEMFTNRDSLANMFNNTFEQERVPVDVTLNQESSAVSPLVASKGKQMNFMDSIDNNYAVEFKKPSLPQSRKSGEMNNGNMDVFTAPKASIEEKDEVFKSAGSTFQFAETDFDFLQNREASSKPWEDDPRNSILLKFDPLLRKPVPVFSEQQLCNRLSGTREEDDELIDIAGMNSTQTIETTTKHQLEHSTTNNLSFNCNQFEQKSMVDAESLIIPLNNVSIMNVDAMKDLINTSQDVNIDVNHYECTDIKKTSNHNEQQEHKIVEMENRIKNEVLKGEDIENKLKEAEMREEALLKRITEKDKIIVKMSGVVEAYEKAIAELVSEKEQLVLKSEKMCADLKHDGEMNAQHLSSLETTFSDLHAKYERTKQLAAEQKEREDGIMQEKKLNADNLKMQEMRYEKMKTHAMTQLEIANTKLSDMTRNHAAEFTKLRAQLKKEEISRASMSEQLLQKTKENAELVKICDELINGQS